MIKIDSFALALRLLSEPLAAQLEKCENRESISEIRLRSGRRLSVLSDGREKDLGLSVRTEDIRKLFERSTGASPYAVRDSLAEGYVNAAGGIRIGFCGELTSQPGRYKSLSSAAIRLPREKKNWGSEYVRDFCSTLILSPPGCGKTTLLRDMVRLLSNGGERVGLCDERGELAGYFEGQASFDVGRCTDVFTGGTRAETALMLLKNMNPTLIAMDELTGEAECRACLQVSRCGVKLLATAHAADREDMERKGLYRELLDCGAFERLLLLDSRHRVRCIKLC